MRCPSSAGCQTTLLQLLTYTEPLAEPVADFVAIVATKHDYPAFLDSVLAYVKAPVSHACDRTHLTGERGGALSQGGGQNEVF
jgi:hypothetical protein